MELTDRFKGLNLIKECLKDGGSWHCRGSNDQDHPQEREKQEGKWLSEEGLQIAEKRREAKGKGEK